MPAHLGTRATFDRLVKNFVAREGRSRSGPRPASSTNPYFASRRKYKEQLAPLLPSSALPRFSRRSPLTGQETGERKPQDERKHAVPLVHLAPTAVNSVFLLAGTMLGP